MVALARPLLRPGCAGGSAASPHGHRRAGVRHRFSPWRLINEPEGFQPPGEELSRVTKAALLRKLQWFSPRGSSVKLPLCPCLVFWCRFQETVLPQDGVCVYGPSEVMAQFKLTWFIWVLMPSILNLRHGLCIPCFYYCCKIMFGV